MKKILRVALITLLASLAILAQAEMYSWVDKNGKKHYGDQIPPEYADQAKTVEVKKTNTMQKPPKVKAYPVPRTQQNNRADNEPAPYDLSSCEGQKRAYEESQACYNDCRLSRGYGGGVNNVSACSHCQDVKKPSCR